MNQKDIRTIAKILLIAAIIVCFFAQIAPWGEIKVSDDSTTFSFNQFYSWGTQTSFSVQNIPMIPNEEGSQLNFYFMMVTDSSFINDEWNSEDRASLFLPFMISVLILPLCLLSLVFGYLDYRKYMPKNVIIGYTAGLCAVSSIILFYLFIQFFIFPISPIISTFYSWSVGFYMMIFAAILFFSAYIIKSKADSMENIIETPKEKEPEPENKTNPSKVCSKCGYENTANEKFCLECGNKL